VLGWIGHPAVRDHVEAARPDLDEIVAPLGLADQLMVTLVVARWLDTTGRFPDGTEWPNPFAGQDVGLLAKATRIGPLFVARLIELGERIAAAGAPLDPHDPGVLLVLAQVALLGVDFTQPPAAIVDDLNILPPGWIERDAAMRGHSVIGVSRHGRRARFRADLGVVAEQVAARLGPAPIGTPYAGGLRRQHPTDERRRNDRRRALAEVLALHPSVTPGRLRATWAAGPASPGGLLRNRLGLQPHDRPPSESTLRTDLRQLRRQPNM